MEDSKLFKLAFDKASKVGITLNRLSSGQLVNGSVCHFSTICGEDVIYHYGYHSIFNLINGKENCEQETDT